MGNSVPKGLEHIYWSEGLAYGWVGIKATRPSLPMFCFQCFNTVLGDVAKATADWRGLKVHVKLTIANKQAAVRRTPWLIRMTPANGKQAKFSLS